MLIGLDLSPALPFIDAGSYFPGWSQSPDNARALWALVDALAADDPHFSVSSFIAHEEAARHFRRHRAEGDLFGGGPSGSRQGRMRVCEHGQRTMGMRPTSCFNLVGAAQVGKSSLTGMRVFNRLGGRIPFWPFDPLPERGPCLVEIYTSIAARAAGVAVGRSKVRDADALHSALAALGARADVPFPLSDHATDALVTAAWLRHVAHDPALWCPAGLDAHVAQTEGWTFGVV